MFLVFALVGIGLMIVGFVLYRNGENFRRSAVETTATITDIQTRRVQTRRRSNIDRHIYDIDFVDHGLGSSIPVYNYEGQVFVSFFVDGREYIGELNRWNSNMRIGQGINIYYDPNDPQNFRSFHNHFVALLIVPFGAVIFIVCSLLILIVHKIKRTKLVY